MPNFALPLPAFNRIHQVIHGTIKEEGNIGALIMNKHYKIPARAVAGGFALCVEPGKNMLFGRDGGGIVHFDEDGFHMWVQTETHVIDFMSPLYQEALKPAGRPGRSGAASRIRLTRRMSMRAGR